MATILSSLLQAGGESILVGAIVGVVTVILVLIFSGIKKAAKGIGQKSKDATKVRKDSDHIE